MDGDDGWHEDCLDLDAYRLDRCETMIHAKLRALYSYWEGLRAGRVTPMRSDIDPRAIDGDVRNLFILEDLGNGNIRFRVAGTAIIDAFGIELRGMNARAIMASPARESFTALIAETLADPGVGYARLRGPGEQGAVWEISLLPLRSDFGSIDRVIGCLHPLTGRASWPDGAPLRFRIEHMSVEPIVATVRERDAPVAVPGFAEPGAPLFRKPVDPPVGERSGLHAIDGGLGSDGEAGDRPARTRGHLRLVDE